jgi:DNA helicase II / ATP-dependent DNA helicase PcrA
MPSADNRVIIACAGSGKTTRLVKEALANPDRRIAMVTYTNNNVREIRRKFGELSSGVPRHVELMTWFEFLMRECARPYQKSKYAKKRIASLLFMNQQSTQGIAESDTERYYFRGGEFLYSDKVSRFVIECENGSSGAVTGRLGEIYTDLFIDEFQDLAGWDYEVLKMLLQSGICVTVVGDPKRHTYSTNPSSKNKQYLGIGAMDLLEEWEQEGYCTLDPMTGTYRCCQPICDFTNALWPDSEPMNSLGVEATGHDGVYVVSENVVTDYVDCFHPQLLRHDKRAKTFGYEALNFGLAKGSEFDRVLIIPTGPIRNYLKSGEVRHIEKSRDRLHVAITRARHSVAFVFDGHSPCVRNRWSP